MPRMIRRGVFVHAVQFALPAATAILACVPILAGESTETPPEPAAVVEAGGKQKAKWTLKLYPLDAIQVYGHDRHVLTVHTIDNDPVPQQHGKAAVPLVTESDLGRRVGLHRIGREWSCGIDVFMFITSQRASTLSRSADAAGGTVDQVDFELSETIFTSTSPAEVLYYDILGDTDLALWTVDVFLARNLGEGPERGLQGKLGLRIGDFDNDYHAVSGVDSVSGVQIDASSNYDLLMGPLVGLNVDFPTGRGRLQGGISQSVLVGGRASLSNMYSDFTGPVTSPSVTRVETFKKVQDATIPITEFHLEWLYPVGRRVSLGLGTRASIWWDVAVPPGIVAGETREAFQESTLVLFSLAGSVVIAF